MKSYLNSNHSKIKLFPPFQHVIFLLLGISLVMKKTEQ